MKQLFDYFPLLVFFGLYFFGGAGKQQEAIILATWGIIIASTLQVILGWAIWRKVQRMHLLVLGFTLVFGGLTVALNDEAFIKWRTSIIYFTLGVILFASHFTPGRNLVHRLGEGLMQTTFGRVIPIPVRNWNLINVAFVLYYGTLGAINLYVAYEFSTDFWVKFKLIGFTLANFIFYPSVFFYVYRSMPEADRQALLHDQPTRREQKKEQEQEHKG